MPRRFEEFYKSKEGDNYGDPAFWNRIFQDIDLRLAAREVDGERINNAVDEMIAVALRRLNDTFTPVINEAITRLASVGALFSATSDTEVAIDDAPKTFVVAADKRSSFVVTEYIAVSPAEDPNLGMVCRTESYDPQTGIFVGTPVIISGSGTFAAWVLRVTAPPNLADVYSTLQVDQMLAAMRANLIDTIVHGAGPQLDQLNELAAALNNDANFSATVLAALSNRVRFDAAQALTDGELSQVQANLGLGNFLSSNRGLPSGGNLNSIVASGMYRLGGGHVNAPPGTDYGQLIVSRGLDTITQIIASYGTAAVWFRSGNPSDVGGAGSWTAWSRLYSTSDAASAAEIRSATGSGPITTDQAYAAGQWTDLGNKSGAVAIDCNTGLNFKMILSGNVTITLANVKDGRTVKLAFVQDATGGRSVSWSGNAIAWIGGSAPSVTTTANMWALFASFSTLPGGVLVGSAGKFN